jgi:hypothetical protein
VESLVRGAIERATEKLRARAHNGKMDARAA